VSRRQNQTPPADHRSKGLFLPDFCAPDAVIGVVVIAELVAIVLTLARAETGAYSLAWTDLARTSFFLLWIGLSSAAFLCKARAGLARLPVAGATALALAGLVLVTAVISEAGWWLMHYWDELRLLAKDGDAPGRLGFLVSNLLICLIVSVAAASVSGGAVWGLKMPKA